MATATRSPSRSRRTFLSRRSGSSTRRKSRLSGSASSTQSHFALWAASLLTRATCIPAMWRARVCGIRSSGTLPRDVSQPHWHGTASGDHERRRMGDSARAMCPSTANSPTSLKQRCPLLHEDSAAHRSEHAAEVELPFLQIRQPQAEIRSDRTRNRTVRSSRTTGHRAGGSDCGVRQAGPDRRFQRHESLRIRRRHSRQRSERDRSNTAPRRSRPSTKLSRNSTSACAASAQRSRC